MSLGLPYTAGLLFLTSTVPGANIPEIVRWRGQYFRWVSGKYRPIADESLEGELNRWLAENPGPRSQNGRTQPLTGSFVREAMSAIKAQTQIPDETIPNTWRKGPPAGSVGPFLATPSGILDLGALEETQTLPPSPEFFSLAALPVSLDPNAQCPLWREFLERTFSGDEATLLQEVFGYCLWPDCRFEQFFLFVGEGGTGKSTVAETLQAMLGQDNTSALALERFSERFALAAMVGKFANISFDVNDIDRTAEGTLKSLVSGEPVAVEQKHAPIVSQRLTAKQIFVTNALPGFRDTSEGLWRRVCLIPFDQVCPEEDRDPRLKFKLRGELPAIAHWALQGLIRLLRQEGFTKLAGAREKVAEYRTECNPAGLYLSEFCEADPEGRVARQALYSSYKQWAQANGHTVLSSTKFNAQYVPFTVSQTAKSAIVGGVIACSLGFDFGNPTTCSEGFNSWRERRSKGTDRGRTINTTISLFLFLGGIPRELSKSAKNLVHLVQSVWATKIATPQHPQQHPVHPQEPQP